MNSLMLAQRFAPRKICVEQSWRTGGGFVVQVIREQSLVGTCTMGLGKHGLHPEYALHESHHRTGFVRVHGYRQHECNPRLVVIAGRLCEAENVGDLQSAV